jgi:hypothetical protein
MSPGFPIYVERGSRRVFAGAIEWPGWCRSARDEDAAIQTLLDYGPRYAAVTKEAGIRFQSPREISSFDVAERLKGNATTDFGAPARAPASDDGAIDEPELDRLRRILDASWSAMDRAAKRAASRTLRKGPRGGGRELDAIMQHVFDADTAYLTKLGGKFRSDQTAKFEVETRRLRGLILDSLPARARGEPLPQPGRAQSLWSPRYFVRRSAWHALDHAWEIEDRAELT